MKKNTQVTFFGLWVKQLPIDQRKQFFAEVFENVFKDLPPEKKTTKRYRLHNWRQGKSKPSIQVQEQIFAIAKKFDENLSINSLFPYHKTY